MAMSDRTAARITAAIFLVLGLVAVAAGIAMRDSAVPGAPFLGAGVLIAFALFVLYRGRLN